MKTQKITLETINKINCAGLDAIHAVFAPHIGSKLTDHLIDKLSSDYEGDTIKWLNSLSESNYDIIISAFNY